LIGKRIKRVEKVDQLKRATAAPLDPDLARLADAWPNLPAVEQDRRIFPALPKARLRTLRKLNGQSAESVFSLDAEAIS
jgi:hypothetical protein